MCLCVSLTIFSLPPALQLYIAIWYLVIDAGLVFQSFYYGDRTKTKANKNLPNERPIKAGPAANGTQLSGAAAGMAVNSASHAAHTASDERKEDGSVRPLVLALGVLLLPALFFDWTRDDAARGEETVVRHGRVLMVRVGAILRSDWVNS